METKKTYKKRRGPNRKPATWAGITLEELQTVRPIVPPMKMIVDYEAMYLMLKARGWLIIQTDPSLDRSFGPKGSMEAPVIKGFNCHVRYKKEILFTRRVGVNAWYVELGTKTEEN